jgi:hypothetical protein
VATPKQSTTPRRLGWSHDYRTNRWSVECPACGKTFEPQTTMLAHQHLTCPARKCGVELSADYNAEPPTVTVVLP